MPWVEYHWTLRWDLPPGTTFPSAVVPHPSCNVTVERGTARRPEAAGEQVLVTGVTTRRFDVDVHGRGWVHGVKLRPGALTALTGHDAKALVDRTVTARDVLPVIVHDKLDDLTAGMPPAEATAAACAALGAFLPAATDSSYDLLLRVVADMLADRSLLRVDQVVERHGVGRRALERLFASYVGVGPKWVLARYRTHDAVTALDEGYAGSLADLAATYGWFDQAHFGRDFAALVGCAPSAYRRRPRQPVDSGSR
ncbi:helix-turn-helix domain-containing protein [Geodermatophilus sp. DSM 44513]|uniref:helix-turn-helix domain-containing protein n=1 Tax=Geodermatophilus sp. DSM 44513 TaxID=1528104 RepID=UPI001AA0D90F|nr:helix-turn-helix domain-containing protein [Geodermatophilus sp. DSM 44513]WNV74268.1 helix-turn-helix domain-containing protein [Geodermatophilus sp. DSM 44513]